MRHIGIWGIIPRESLTHQHVTLHQFRSETETLKAHKAVLAARCDYFRAMFGGYVIVLLFSSRFAHASDLLLFHRLFKHMRESTCHQERAYMKAHACTVFAISHEGL